MYTYRKICIRSSECSGFRARRSLYFGG